MSFDELAETLNGVYGKSEERLTRAVERGQAQMRIWSNQVDAAAVVGAETKVDGGGCARALRQWEVEERRRGKGKKKRTLNHIYKVKG